MSSTTKQVSVKLASSSSPMLLTLDIILGLIVLGAQGLDICDLQVGGLADFDCSVRPQNLTVAVAWLSGRGQYPLHHK